jgi:hypothetical protein
MSARMAGRTGAVALLTLLVLVSTALVAFAQPIARLRVARRAPILDTPRVDGFVLGTVDPGVELDVVAQQGPWLQVDTPSGFSRPRGWMQASSITWVTPPPAPPKAPQGTWHIRGFGTAAPVFFTANNSFETILGSSTGLFFGGGAQVVWPNGLFVLGSYEQMRKTGSRVLVSGTQVYTLPIADEVTVTPVNLTVGYRDYRTRFASVYVGAGAGWHRLRESTPGQDAISESHASGHVLIGVEKPLQPWFGVAGEFQWTGAPGILGHTGISNAVSEDDLGGIALRFKVIVGR